MVLAQTEHVQAELLGELYLLHQLSHPLLGADPSGHVGECGNAQFHHWIIPHSCASNYFTAMGSEELRRCPTGVWAR